MPILTDPGFPTLQNVTKRLRPDGSVENDMANLATKKVPTLEDIPWREANNGTTHKITATFGAPPPQWRTVNQGIKPQKGDSFQWLETCGLVEDYSDIDPEAAAGTSLAEFRKSEDDLKVAEFGKEIVRAIFYENATTAPERIHGLAPRFTGANGTQTKDYVLLKGTRSGINCESVWLINWDEETCFGIYPKGSMAGLSQRDLGERTLTKSDGSQLQVFTTHFKQKPGLAVRDYRRVIRMQWDPDDAAFADDKKSMYLALQEMLDAVYDLGPNARLYMSRRSMAKFNQQVAANNLNVLQWLELNGRVVPNFRGVPIRVEDTLVPESAL
ncbi:MAG TPA: hypothetical protein VN033_10290 [Vulgatibacter sp.]|nr:hypothetical protein [Vulgatibacter sp.]